MKEEKQDLLSRIFNLKQSYIDLEKRINKMPWVNNTQFETINEND